MKKNVTNHLGCPGPSRNHLYICVKCVCVSIYTQRYMLPLWHSKCGLWIRRIGLPWKFVANAKSQTPLQNAASSFSQDFRVICVHSRVSEALPWKCYDNHVNNKMRESLKDEDPTFLIIKRTVYVQICLWFLVWWYQSKLSSLGQSANCHSLSSLGHFFHRLFILFHCLVILFKLSAGT